MLLVDVICRIFDYRRWSFLKASSYNQRCAINMISPTVKTSKWRIDFSIHFLRYFFVIFTNVQFIVTFLSKVNNELMQSV